jgi:uncharacterized membrane protein
MDDADPDRSEYDRAATNYLIWPLSLFELAREPANASTWSRIHTRQAVTYGLVVSLGFILLMALPLLIVIGAPAISTGATVAVYAAGLVADLVVFVALVVATFAFAAKASRGELFDIPFVSMVADRVFRLRR